MSPTAFLPHPALSRHTALVFAAAVFTFAVSREVSSAAAPPSGLWQDVEETAALASHGGVSAKTARQNVLPQQYRTLRLDRTKLTAALDAALPEGTLSKAMAAGVPAAALPAPAEIELPIPHSDKFARCLVESSPIMEPELAARYPDIRTYTIQGIDNPEISGRIDTTLFGFHAMIFSPGGQIVVDPYFADGSDPSTAIAYYKRDYTASQAWNCGFHTSDKLAAAVARKADEASVNRPTGASLRVYRLALAATLEYCTAVGGASDTSVALGAIVTTVNRVDAVYERDFAIRMVLINNTDKLIKTSTNTANVYPYTNSNGGTMLTQNQTACDALIGTANYDIGHVFSTGGGGVAYLGCVCNASNKAGGVTGSSNPIGDPYDIDYVAHEMGHQFGGNHTFNGTTSSCGGGNRNASTAYEPASGVTIMAYAGICSASSSNIQDLAPNSDDFFNTASYVEIDNYTTTGTGKNTVLPSIATGNTPPTVTSPAGTGTTAVYTIPLNTPFALTAAGSDANGDRITYCWEQTDVGAAINATTIAGLDNGASPIFRPIAPTTSPTRIFPALEWILASNGTTNNAPPLRNGAGYLVGETLPSVNRASGLNFRCTVRDNRAGGGGSNYVQVKVATLTGTGPFNVTAPENASLSYAAGASLPVTWNVGGTTAAPISCATVKISLSTDGGLTFPYVLATGVANSGSTTVTLPTAASIATKQARIKVEAENNIFFDIDNLNFTITSSNTPPTYTASTTGLTVVRGTPTAATATVGTVAAGSNALSSVSVSGVPDGATVTGAISGSNVVLSGTAECRLTTTLTTRTYPVRVTVTDAAGATSSGTVNLIIQPNLTPTLGTYAAASVGQGGSVTVTPSAAPADGNGNLPAAPMSLAPAPALPTGVTASFNQATGAVTFTAASTTTQGTYAVRVQVQDTCGAAVEKSFNLTVTAPTTSAPAFTSATPTSPAAAGTAYSYTFTASGNPAPTFAVTAGTLPPGLSLNGTTGVLNGTPTTPGVYSGIQVTASNGTTPNATQTFSIRINSTQSSYAASYGLTGSNAAPAADPDGDGLNNLAEYAFNLNPAVSDAGSTALPASAVAVRTYSGGNYLSIRFTRVPLATDISYIVETSPDPTSAWTTVASSSGGAALSGAGLVSDDASTTAAHTVEVRDTVAQDPASAPKRFIRVRITQQ